MDLVRVGDDRELHFWTVSLVVVKIHHGSITTSNSISQYCSGGTISKSERRSHFLLYLFLDFSLEAASKGNFWREVD